MENQTTNQIRMCELTNHTLSTYSDKWAGFIPFENSVVQFRSSLSIINKKIGTVLSLDNGASNLKMQYCQLMADSSIKICNIVYAYAIGTGDIILKKQMDISKSRFLKLADAEKAEMAQMILNVVSPMIESLSDYKISQDDLDQLQQHTQNFRSVMNIPKMNINLVSEAIVELKLEVRKAINILKILDHLMLHFENDEREFFDLYFKARNILDYGHRHKKTSKANIESSENLNSTLDISA